MPWLKQSDRHRKRLLKNGVPATARLLHVHNTEVSSGSRFIVKVKIGAAYTTEDGRQVESTQMLGFNRWNVPAEGALLAIRYDRDDPSDWTWDEAQPQTPAGGPRVAEALELAAKIRSRSDGEPPSAPQAPATADPLDELKKLADLRDRGALTAAEFEAHKAKLLGQ